MTETVMKYPKPSSFARAKLLIPNLAVLTTAVIFLAQTASEDSFSVLLAADESQPEQTDSRTTKMAMPQSLDALGVTDLVGFAGLMSLMILEHRDQQS